MAPDLGLATQPQTNQATASPTMGQRVATGLQNVGLVLGNVGAGIQGRELPTDRLRKERRQQAVQNMQIISFGLNAINQVREQAKTIEPGPARDDFVKKWGQKLDEVMPGISDLIPKAVKEPDWMAFSGADELVKSNPAVAAAVMSGDQNTLINVLLSPGVQKQTKDYIDRREIGKVTEQLPRWMQKVKELYPEEYAANQKNGWTVGEMVSINQRLPNEGPGVPPEQRTKFASLGERALESDIGKQALSNLIGTQETGGTLVRLVAPDGTQITRRRDDPEVDQLIKQGYNLASPTGTPAEAGLTKPTITKEEQKITTLVDAMGRMDEIEKGYRGEYLTYAGQIKGEALNRLDKAGWPIGPESAEYVSNFKNFQSSVAHDLDQFIHDLSGAAVSGDEANRLGREALDAAKLGPTAFRARLHQIRERLAYGFARHKWILDNGLAGKPDKIMSLGDMEAFMTNAGAEIYQGYKDQGVDNDMAIEMANEQLREQFGFAPGDI